MRVARALALLAAAWSFASLAWVIAHRVTYPFDLEWLEGATLWHAERLVDGLPLYPPPTIDFVPHPYPPLYPALLALLARAAGGVSYALGRALSICSFAGALVVGWRFLRSAGAGRRLAAAAMAIPCAAYVVVGSWYDLARVDSLWLLLTAAGATVAWRAPRSNARVVAAALLLVGAFFAKQTAAPFMAAVALALAVVDRRAALVFVGALAVAGLSALAAMQRATDGWFWFYVFAVHQSHAFYARAALRVPGRIMILLLPSVPLVAWALWRRRSPALGWAAWLTATGIAVAAVGKGTAGGFTNAFIPAIYFSSLLIGVAGRQLVDGDAAGRRATIAWALLAATIAFAPRVVPRAVQAVAPSAYGDRQTTGYALAGLVPTREARARNEALIARLRAVDGDVWLPTRPWYARLAGKRPLAGEMGAVDVAPTGVPVTGLDEALRTRSFAAVVVDDPFDPLLRPLFARSTATRFDGARDVVGKRRPTWWLAPRSGLHADGASGCAGSSTQNAAPPPSVRATVIVPPSARATSRASASPSPNPSVARARLPR